MNKKLPKLFINKIDKPLNNNEKVYYAKNGEEENNKDNQTKSKNKESSKISLQNITTQQKIRNIFNSPRYIYKANVNIKLKNGDVTKQIIGRNKNHLIAFDNELIPIADIIDIDFAE